MLELIIDQNKENKTIALVENGKLVEIYEEDENLKRNEGNIYIGTVKDVLKGMQAAFVDIGTEKNSFIHLKDLLPKIDEKKEKHDENIDIKDVIKINDKILVQVKKDSNEKKGARISTHINLPSRYIVLMPNTSIITISQKIVNEQESKRLIKIMQENLPKSMGAIIRTSSQGKSEEELVKDLKSVIKKWEQIQQKFNNEKENAPVNVYKSPDIVEKIIIDLFDKGLEKITVNDKKYFEELTNSIGKNKDYNKLNICLKEGNILNVYDIENQMKKIQDRKVWLNCGGFITIDKTEALTAIDVNTGKYTGNKNLEDTIYKVNEEATYEIAKQLRLRDIGGIIIVDYIDMRKDTNKEKIEKLLKEKLKSDRAKTQVEGFTKLDLMELTRKNICSHKD